jgi:hypothetical protein
MRRIPTPLLTMLAFGAACTANPEDPATSQPANLEVRTLTSGAPADTDGYVLTVAGFGDQTVPANGAFWLRGLVPGTYQLLLGGIAANCVVLGSNPMSIMVTGGAVLHTAFEIQCEGNTSLAVQVHTEGDDPDADGYAVLVNGVSNRGVGDNAVVTFDSLPPGSYTVYLAGLQSNCVIQGPDARRVTVQAGQATRISFEVACPRLAPGSLLVSLATTLVSTVVVGSAVSIDGNSSVPIASNGYLVIGPLAPGEHVVRLSASGWCYGNRGPVGITMVAGGIATVRFNLTCGVFFP